MAWQNSAHRNVPCETCHIEPGTTGLIAGKVVAIKEVYDHVLTAYKKPINKGSRLSKRIPSAVCTSCHKSPGEVTTDRIKFTHKKHIDLGLNCAFCHNRVGHASMKTYSDRISMLFCLDCHKQKKASVTCETCHPAVFKLKPISHEQNNWIKDHGKTKDLSTCTSCHTDKAGFCDKCHGAPVPHPQNWKNTHGRQAGDSREKCLVCHQASRCDNCHHTVNPHQTGWKNAHPSFVKTNGSGSCNTCHGISFCANCHSKTNPHPAGWRSIHPEQVERTGSSSCLGCHTNSFCSNCHNRSGGGD